MTQWRLPPGSVVVKVGGSLYDDPRLGPGLDDFCPQFSETVPYGSFPAGDRSPIRFGTWIEYTDSAQKSHTGSRSVRCL
jgi:hypothetical protein